MNRYFSMIGALLTCVGGCTGGASADGASARLDGAALPVLNIQQDTPSEGSASSVPVRVNLEQTQKDIINELAFVAPAKVGTHACGDDAAVKFVFVWADGEGASDGGGRVWGVSTERNIESQGERQASVGSCSVTIESLEPDGKYLNARGTFTAQAVDAITTGIVKAAASARPARKLDGTFQVRLLRAG